VSVATYEEVLRRKLNNTNNRVCLFYVFLKHFKFNKEVVQKTVWIYIGKPNLTMEDNYS